MNPKQMIMCFYVIVIGIAIIILITTLVKAKLRIKDFKLLAAKMGFTFKEEKNHLITDYQMDFKLFDKGRSKKITAYMEATKNDVTLAVFDYKFVTGGGKNSTTHKETIISFKNNSFSFPQFTLMRENMAHKLLGSLSSSLEKSLLGFNDIDFPDSPLFSEKYLLGGKNPEKIKELFTFDVRTELEKYTSSKQYDINIFAAKDTVLFQIPQAKVRVKNIPEKIQMCSDILKAFTA